MLSKDCDDNTMTRKTCAINAWLIINLFIWQDLTFSHQDSSGVITTWNSKNICYVLYTDCRASLNPEESVSGSEFSTLCPLNSCNLTAKTHLLWEISLMNLLVEYVWSLLTCWYLTVFWTLLHLPSEQSLVFPFQRDILCVNENVFKALWWWRRSARTTDIPWQHLLTTLFPQK